MECGWGGEGCLRGKFLFCIRSFAPFLPPPFVQFSGARARRVFPLCHSQSSRTDERTFRLLLLYLEGERAIELHNGVKTRFSTSTRLHSTFAAIDGRGGRMRQAPPSLVTRLLDEVVERDTVECNRTRLRGTTDEAGSEEVGAMLSSSLCSGSGGARHVNRSLCSCSRLHPPRQ